MSLTDKDANFFFWVGHAGVLSNLLSNEMFCDSLLDITSCRSNRFATLLPNGSASFYTVLHHEEGDCILRSRHQPPLPHIVA